MSAAQQRRRSGRGKGGGNNNQGNNKGGNNKGGNNKSGRSKRAADFWEVPGTSADDLAAAVTVPDDPTALVRSLGAPALPGQGTNAEHYFMAVYEKASHVAAALATANGLLADAASDDKPQADPASEPD